MSLTAGTSSMPGSQADGARQIRTAYKGLLGAFREHGDDRRGCKVIVELVAPDHLRARQASLSRLSRPIAIVQITRSSLDAPSLPI